MFCSNVRVCVIALCVVTVVRCDTLLVGWSAGLDISKKDDIGLDPHPEIAIAERLMTKQLRKVTGFSSSIPYVLCPTNKLVAVLTAIRLSPLSAQRNIRLISEPMMLFVDQYPSLTFSGDQKNGKWLQIL